MIIKKYKTQLKNQIPYLISEKRYVVEDDFKVTKPSDVFDFCKNVLKTEKMAEEYSHVICFNSKGCPIGFFELSHGTINSSFMNTREVFQKALLIGAASIVLTHNHPSGDSAFSHQDIEVTKRIVEAGVLMSVPVNDHIITGIGNYYSMREMGHI